MRLCARLTAVVTCVAMLALALAGCGETFSSVSPMMCLATDFSTSGSNGALGLSAQNAVDLAVSQAALAGGYTLTTLHYSSQNAKQAQQNMTDAASQSCARGVIGPNDDIVAAAGMPIAINAGLPLLTPGLTNPALTNSADAPVFGLDFSALHPSNKQNAFFRLSTTDDLLASATARALVQHGASHVYVVDDGQPYGVSVGNFFVAALQRLGGKLAGRASSTTSTSAALGATVAGIVSAAADGIFYAGSTSGAAALRQADTRQLPFAVMTTTPLDPAYIQIADLAAEGTLTVSALPYVASLQDAQGAQFVTAYTQRYGAAPTPLAVSAYDAAEIVISSIRAIIASGNVPYLPSVLTHVTTQQYTGIAGSYWFTTTGDNVLAALPNLYVVRNGAWVLQQQIEP